MSAVTVLAGCLILAAPSAQEKPQATFRSVVRLIVQPVTVKDKKGKPVSGLTKNDFVLTEDGQPQEIAFVEYQDLESVPAAAVDVSPETPARPAPAAPAVAPVTEPGVVIPLPGDPKYRGKRLVVLYFDLYQMPFFDQMRAFTSAEAYIGERMTGADLLAVLAFQGRGVELKQDFTADKEALREALRQLVEAAEQQAGGISFDPGGGAFGDDDDAFNIFSTDRQLAALQTAVTGLGPLPEVKTLVYLGSGLRLNGANNQAQLRATVNAAIRSNVTINPIDTRGLVASAPLGDATRRSPGGIGMFSGALAGAATLKMQQAQDTLYALAKDTGGVAMFDNNDLAHGIARAAEAVTGYYMIGYYSRNSATDGRYRRVKVTLASDVEASLSYRAGYYADKPYARFNRADKERQLAEALRLEDPITDIPMAAEVHYFQVSGAEYFVPISLRMPGSELTRPRPTGTTRAEIDLIGEIKDEYGVTVRNARDLLTFKLDAAAARQVAGRPIQYETGFTLLPGRYVIKLLARDATTGRIGTFQRDFTIPNLEKASERLPTSSVVLTSQRVARTDALYTVRQRISSDKAHPLVADGQTLVPSVTRTFSASRPLYVFLEAYQRDAPAMRPLVAFVAFYRDGAKVLETDPLGVTEGRNPASRAVPIRFTIALDRLPLGAYDCQVTVLEPVSGRAAFWRAPIVLMR